MKVELTSFSGDRKVINVADAKAARLFIQEYPKRLPKDVRMKVRVDALAIERFVQGTL